MRAPFNFNRIISFFETQATSLSSFTSNLMQQKNPQSTQTSPEALSAQNAVAASLAKRSLVSTPPTQASTSTRSTSSASVPTGFGPYTPTIFIYK